MSNVEWTKEQLEAIKNNGNNILVAAAAGSGKTAVLVERIINKIINENIDIEQLLIVTFTNAAASEMRERILEAIYKKIEESPENEHLQKQINLISKANICTIDSFCLDVVKNNFYEIGITPNFRIADNAELELLKLETLEELFDLKYEEKNSIFLKLLDTYTTYSGDEPLKELCLNTHRFLQSNPFPRKWIEEQIKKYNLENDLKKDFSKTEWGKIILKNLKSDIEDAKIKLQALKNYISRFNELKKYEAIIDNDIELTECILKAQKWDEVFEITNNLKFSTWIVDKKITLEEKEIAKEKRNDIKEQIKKSLEIIDCNSEKANRDIFKMYDILKCFTKLLFEYDNLLIKNKNEKNIVEFSDIEHMALNILLKEEKNNFVPTEVALKYKNKFIEIAIDEYQDSNLIQESILTSISNGKNIFMVGDVKQSIYKFRQARPELFLDKYNTYDITNNMGKKSIGNKIQLFKNFRSRENVLETTNIIFENIMSKRLGEINYTQEEFLNLGASYDNENKNSVRRNTQIYVIDKKQNKKLDEDQETEDFELLENIELEAKFVANKIKEIIESKELVLDKKNGYRPITYRDIVILLRSTKDKANIFEKEISKLNMPIYSDTSLEYLNSIEIQTMMNLLKVIDNPTIDIPLVAILRSFIGGFTDNELIEIRLLNKNLSFYELMIEYSKSEEGKIELKNKILNFLNKLSKWKEQSEYYELDEFIWKIFIDTGYYNYVSLMPDGILRQANLKSLFEKAKKYNKVSFKGLYNFINFIDKVKSNSGDLSSAKLIGENENVIRIMSIHKSKGLEFPVVFLCNSEKKFNMQDLNEPILLHQDLGFGLNYIEKDMKLQYTTLAKEAIKIKVKEETISEEMRVLYVALTRAKERLIITGISNDIENDIKKKEALLQIYSNEQVINFNIVKKYKSYLDWIELVFLKNKDKNIMSLNICNIKDIELDNNDIENKLKMNDFIEQVNKNNGIDNDLIKKIEWKYDFIELSKLEGKSSVSKIKQQGINDVMLLKTPNFMKEQIKKLTGAQKGTLLHLCMQYLDIKKEYKYEDVVNLVKTLLLKKIITQIEWENIDFNKILKFTKSKIWKEMKKSKLIEREKAFYISLNADEIYSNNIEEKVLIQGIIDLYYINENDELVLVDYKTDYVKDENELIVKYKRQLELYKEALESGLKRKVKYVYIYSICLEKEIIIDFFDNKM